MILDQIERAPSYWGLSENLKKGFEFIRQTDLHRIQPGKYEISGNEVFALVSEYETKPHDTCLPEAHRIYTDIQFIVSGQEWIGYAPLDCQPEIAPYSQEKDIAFFQADTAQVLLSRGMFAVFFPHDIHRPCMQIDRPEMVKKVVVKVKC